MSNLSPARRWAALTVLVGAILLLAIDGTVLYLAVPSLTEDLSPTANQILWIGDIYSLAIAGLLVTMGNIADRVGRKKLLLIGSAAFGLASALAAFAPTAEVLIAARLLLGIAGASLMPSTLSLIRNIFTDPVERTRAIAIWSASAAAGIALGPLVGGVLLEHFWWGSVFLINIPVMVAMLIFGGWLLPESKDPHPGPFDLVSSALSMLAIIPIVYAIKQVAGGTFGVDSVIALIIGMVSAWLFARRQRRSTSPMIDLALFRNPSFSGAVLVNFISVFALTGVLFFFSQYLQLARELSPLQAGLAELPIALAGMLAIAAVGVLLRRLGLGRAIAASMIAAAIGLALLSLVEHGPLFWVIVVLIPLGLGIGIAETLSVDAVVSAVRPEKAGAAASISETAYELGVALGIALLGSLMTVLYRWHLVLPAGTDPSLEAAAEDSLGSAVHVLPPNSASLDAARDAFVTAMQTTTLIASALLALAAFVAWRFIPSDRRGTTPATEPHGR
ncbi:MAG: MFS transporter [Microbacteriaceae bacterium]|nr:MFS transporter [Microbacteriaceae bacterium]